MGANDDLIKDFLIESYEGLELLNEKLVALEENPDSHETLSSIFRTFHSIKGSCGFLELHKLEALTHAGENLLSDLREGKFGVNDEIATALLSLVDAVNEMLAILESTGVEGEEEYQDLITELKALREGGGTPTHAAPKAGKKSAPVDAGDAGGAAGASLSTNSIRIQVGQLDSLMNLASELVLARNRILQLAAKTQDADMTVTSQRLNLITSELQEGIMKIRMQPIGGLWRSFPRLVRDLAKSCGKSINLHMEGQETELDKTVLEAVKDPLNHILRNSVDHGLETPAEREAAGKSPEGKLQLRAYHESGQVIIEVRDDGRGMDPAKLKEKAIQKGLLTPEQASELGDRQALNLIFHAGFSTAAAVTNLSGRGVGMDVVRTNIEAIGGSVEVISEVGRGTLIRVRTPDPGDHPCIDRHRLRRSIRDSPGQSCRVGSPGRRRDHREDRTPA
ncbi:MAG: chemotaxis protein CheA [Planctomycetota bacterium]